MNVFVFIMLFIALKQQSNAGQKYHRKLNALGPLLTLPHICLCIETQCCNKTHNYSALHAILSSTANWEGGGIFKCLV